jgi:hypothetical protein
MEITFIKKSETNLTPGTSVVILCRILYLPVCYPKIYRTVILPLVYGCGTWSVTMREEHRLRTFHSRMLRKIFGPKRDEITGNWKRLHDVGLHD